jgi:hypothetical protein
MSIFKNKGCTFFLAIACMLWYAVFEWPVVDYPSYAKGPCYSPNHAYYITRHQTLWQSTNLSHSSEFGTARLFNRSGKLLYQKDTSLGGQAGPMWFDGAPSRSADPPQVFFMDNTDPGWIFILPSSPGNGSVKNNCY